MYNLEEVKKATLKYFDDDELAMNVWINKYALKDKEGNIYELTPDDMHRRLAKEVARIESKYPNPITEEEVYDLLKGFKYIVPQGSPMHGIGNNFVITCCLTQGPELPYIMSEGFFDKNVLAQLHCSHCCREVCVVRCRNNNGIDVFMQFVKHFTKIRITRNFRHCLICPCRSMITHITKCNYVI